MTATPLEDLAAWAIHRIAADAVRKLGGHFTCSTEIGFQAVERKFCMPPGSYQANPCAKCRRLYEEATKP